MPVFVASDGTQFEDRAAWRRYEFETNYAFRNKVNERLVKLPGKIAGQPFDLSDLTGCEVLLLDQCDQVQVDNLANCRVFIGPSSESVFVRNCTNCTFTVACKQLRTRDCTDCSFSLYSLTDPIIETSSGMKFAPFDGAYNGLQQHFTDARLEPTNNHWSLVYDFNDPDKSGHNWSLLKPSDVGAGWVIDLTTEMTDAGALGPCINPVPKDAGYVRYGDDGSNSGTPMQSFSFGTSQHDAEKLLSTMASCQAQEPAKTIALPPVPTLSEDTQPFPPPVPTLPSPLVENQKLSVIEKAEVLNPPPVPSTGYCSPAKLSDPVADTVVEMAVDMLQTISFEERAATTSTK